MKKIEIHVTETIRHKVSMELEDETVERLVKELTNLEGNDYAGDLTNGNMTCVDGEYTLEYYNIFNIE